MRPCADISHRTRKSQQFKRGYCCRGHWGHFAPWRSCCRLVSVLFVYLNLLYFSLAEEFKPLWSRFVTTDMQSLWITSCNAPNFCWLNYKSEPTTSSLLSCRCFRSRLATSQWRQVRMKHTLHCFFIYINKILFYSPPPFFPVLSVLRVQRQAAAQVSSGTVKTDEIHYGQIVFSKKTPEQTSSQTTNSRGQQCTLSTQEPVYAQVKIEKWTERAEVPFWSVVTDILKGENHLASSKNNVNEQCVKYKRMSVEASHPVLVNDEVVFILLTLCWCCLWS